MSLYWTDKSEGSFSHVVGLMFISYKPSDVIYFNPCPAEKY